MTENKENLKKKKQKKIKKAKGPFRGQRIFASILVLLVVVALGVVTVFSVYAKGVIDASPELYVEDFIQPESSKIYDRDGNEIYDTGLKIRENITYEELPQSLIDAFIAVEDSRFFGHNGFDVPRFTKAAIENLLSSLRDGELSFGQGGSTFTMQLIKNTYYTSENAETGEVVNPEVGASGIDRKIQEIYLSQKLEKEQMLSKKLILELYLNMINFGAGNNILGVQNSAEAFFNKDVSELSLLESAFLAGVINAPSRNTPYNSINHATKRTHTVLDLMEYHGYITEDELNLAKSIKLENIFADREVFTGDAYDYQAYIDVVINEVTELTGSNPTVVPMKVYTAMDAKIQDGIDSFQKREIYDLDQGKDTNIQVGSTIVDNSSGEIIGIVGGYDYNGQLIHNRASSKTVQPASVIKPVVDYALGFEYLGYATSHVLVDEPWQYAGTDVTVGNYDNRYLGEITLMHAVADSRNIPALKTLQAAYNVLGRDGVVGYLNDVGFSQVTEDSFDIGYGIGGSSFVTSPIEMAGAYTMLMNGGNYTEPHTVTRVEFSDGREPLIPQHANTQVISSAAAYLTTRTMKYAVEGPYPGFLRSISKPYTVFGKTGTNGWGDDRPGYVPQGAQRDRLMIAATDQFSIATWAGFDKYDEKYKPWFSDAEASFNLPGKLNSYLLDLLEENYGSGNDIERPSGVSDIRHITGPFPYQSPMDGMNPDLISNGLIKNEFLNLTSAKPQELDKLKSQSVKVSQNRNTLNIDVEMSPYPDPEKLKVAPRELVMKFPGSNQTVTGAKLYDDSWLFGAVRYKTELRINDSPVKEVMTDNNKQTLDYQLTGNESKIEVCSYYTFDLSPSRKSNIECSAVEVSSLSLSGPSTNLLEDLTAWADSNSIQYTVNWNDTDRIDRHMVVNKTKPNIINQSINISQLKQSGIEFDVNEFVLEVDKGDKYNKIKAKIDGLVNYMTVEVIGNGKYIGQVTLDDVEIDEIRLRNDAGKKLTIVLTDSD